MTTETEGPTTGEQASLMVQLINAILKRAESLGVTQEVMSICLVRMAAVIGMDSGQTMEDFAEFARQEYGNVPLKRKQGEEASNVIPIGKSK
jgi:hypothetical protein